MLANEQIAHDLAVAFVQAKAQRSENELTNDFPGFEDLLGDYRIAYTKIMELINDGK